MTSTKRPCLACGRQTTNPRFCSNKCQRDFDWQKVKARIDADGCCPPRLNTKLARRYLLQTRGHRCEICGLTEWRDKTLPLVLDHINGDANDWLLSNLRLICPNCDALAADLQVS